MRGQSRPPGRPRAALLAMVAAGALAFGALAHLAASVTAPSGSAGLAGLAGPADSAGLVGSAGSVGSVSALVRLALADASVACLLGAFAVWAAPRSPGRVTAQVITGTALVALALDALATTQLTGTLERTPELVLVTVGTALLLPSRRGAMLTLAAIVGAWLSVAAAAGPTRSFQFFAAGCATALAIASRNRH